MAQTTPLPPHREAFITIGATASFLPLIDTSLSPPFLTTLSSLEYTHLTIQCGPDLAYAISKAEKEGKSLARKELGRNLNPRGDTWEGSRMSGWWEIQGIRTRLFDFNKEGLGGEMRNCKASKPETEGTVEGRREGVVVSHAGPYSKQKERNVKLIREK
jgi:hypothetical protein